MKLWERLSLALILLGAVWLRIPLLSIGLWRDEGYTYSDISAPTLQGMVAHIAASEAHPPLFFFLLREWTHAFGFGEFTLQSFPFLWSIAAIGATYALARLCLSRAGALAAALFLATAYQAVIMAGNVRPYSMAQCLLAVCVALYCQAVFAGSSRMLWAWAGCAIALVWTQYAGLLLLPCLLAATLAFRKNIVVEPRRLIAAYGVVLLAFLPWLPICIGHVRAGTPWARHWWAGEPAREALVTGGEVLLNTADHFAPGSALIQRLAGRSAADWSALGAAAMLLFLFCRRREKREPKEAISSFLLVLLACALVLVVTTGYTPVDRYFSPFVSLVALAYAVLAQGVYDLQAGMLRVRFHVLCRLLYAALATFVVCDAVLGSRTGAPARSGVRELVQDALPLKDRQRVAWLVAPDYIASTLRYYLDRALVAGVPPPVIHGFARWDQPEFFRVAGYAALWREPDLVQRTLDRVDRLACEGFDELAFVKPTPYGLNDSAEMLYSRTNELEENLRRLYPVLDESAYPGGAEDASLVRFRLATKRLCLPKTLHSGGQ